ncbi:MAG: DUF3842 family protein [Clostridia bacterium]|nr:DUF3842 family protein [Clostridia bacterium]
MQETRNVMRIAVIDGQGGGIGRLLVEKLSRALRNRKVEILVLGTNVLATSAMLKAGANEGATGENAVVQNVAKVDIIAGTISLLMAHSMLGEFTPAMAQAVAGSPAIKVLLHLNRSGVEVVGTTAEPLPHLVDMLVERVNTLVKSHEESPNGKIGPIP